MRTGWSRAALVACGAMFAASFILLAIRYPALPLQVAVLRGPIAGGVLLAPRSLFTVFRVPLMNLIHGTMAAVMLSCSSSFYDARRRPAYERVFRTLLFAVALKSDFEGLELSGLASNIAGAAGWLTRGAIASVILGVVLALVYMRAVPLPWTELRLGAMRTWALIGLLLVYVGILAGTLFVAHHG